MRAILLSCGFVFINVLAVIGQNIYIHTVDNSIHTYPLVDVNSITFADNVMNLNLISLDTVPWNISSVDYYNYDQWFVSVPEGLIIDQNGVTVYPNPTAGNLNVTYNLLESASVNLEILDLSGRLVERKLLGMQHVGTQNIQYKLIRGSLSSGTYVCRLLIGNTIYNKLFILKQ